MPFSLRPHERVCALGPLPLPSPPLLGNVFSAITLNQLPSQAKRSIMQSDCPGVTLVKSEGNKLRILLNANRNFIQNVKVPIKFAGIKKIYSDIAFASGALNALILSIVLQTPAVILGGFATNFT